MFVDFPISVSDLALRLGVSELVLQRELVKLEIFAFSKSELDIESVMKVVSRFGYSAEIRADGDFLNSSVCGESDIECEWIRGVDLHKMDSRKDF